MKTILTQAMLKDALLYNPVDGVFTRAKTAGRCGRWREGTVVGHLAAHGYVQIWICGKSYLAHRLAWFYVYGVWPDALLDHINGKRDDNRIENLRECNDAMNMQNIRCAHSDNSTGLLGVKKLKGGRFYARIFHNKKEVGLGSHDTAEKAHEAYLDAKRRLHDFCTI